MLTWAQRTSQKPIAVLNTNGFYDALLVLLETMMKKGF
jgi:predicted Rossmann-fold nucleotide-binding protein